MIMIALFVSAMVFLLAVAAALTAESVGLRVPAESWLAAVGGRLQRRSTARNLTDDEIRLYADLVQE